MVVCQCKSYPRAHEPSVRAPDLVANQRRSVEDEKTRREAGRAKASLTTFDGIRFKSRVYSPPVYGTMNLLRVYGNAVVKGLQSMVLLLVRW
ncbi:hypothetical protein JCM14469_14170 [Desulfatiferula olefinivorans]